MTRSSGSPGALLIALAMAAVVPVPVQAVPLPVLPTAGGAPVSPVRDRYDPCTDGRFSDGHPHSCAELHDWLDRRRDREDRRGRYDPCTDGRVSDGRARSCDELLDWLDRRRDRDDERPWRGWR
ncbi:MULTISPECIES: hypothetical protein [Inquilinus]|uniref:Secreted protein n=1 Tax=Inquilinus ginsengisoli TaxID=363840 RepID=A0ABU1JYL7_9PROT|nr:hypothetical protein [Inquilinus ginsengisoli]MDR6292650.1 hypothetical protein [Inquilinus ginsengisoli]